jgi:hypothetical protein
MIILDLGAFSTDGFKSYKQPNAQALAAPLAVVERATRGGTQPLPANARAAAGSLWKERATDRGRRALAGESNPGYGPRQRRQLHAVVGPPGAARLIGDTFAYACQPRLNE